jgi:type VI secretion system secreted protein VgrG
MAYTQAARHIAISTPLGKDVLLLRGFHGSEAISQLFQFDLDLLSENDSVSFHDLVGKNVTLRIFDADGAERHWHGFISRFSQGALDQRFASYHAQMVPWLWFLTRTSDCRIFQNQNAPDIIQKVFKDLGFHDFELRLYGDFTPRDYCVQYRETDFNFVSRLMEEEGIYYYFRHEGKKHVMVLANDPAGHEPVPKQKTVRYASNDAAPYEDVITEWQYQEEFRPGKWTQTDYNFETPSTSLAVSVDGKNPYEIYEYPGEHRVRAEGDRLARIRLQEQVISQATSHGAGVCRQFSSGFKFTLQGHYRANLNQAYLLTSVNHSATQEGGYTGDAAAGEELAYSNTFECIPFSTPFRPSRITPQPVVRGCQTAVVVGPSGEEIYTDKHGRVKVQFHWDREGKRDENSSCWIRVSHPSAGKGWGSVSIPRIGQEVIVDFLEGNPDEPIIVGRVYNAEQMPPFGMPAGAMIGGLKSNSTKGGGGYNEISMNDTKGKEMLTVHAQYDMSTTVKHDDTQTIETGDRTITVKTGKHTETIKGDTAITIQTGNHSLAVQTGTHTETIKGNTSVIVQTGAYSLDVVANTHTHHVKGKVTENYDATQDTTVNGDVLIKSKTAKITLDASSEIYLHCGASMLSMKPDGTIKMEGTNIEISGGNSVKVGVGNQNVTCDKQKVATSGAAINSSAVGMHEITGALVKIN